MDGIANETGKMLLNVFGNTSADFVAKSPNAIFATQIHLFLVLIGYVNLK